MTDDLPNLGLLIKLLKLTTSSHDAEALSAMRKANEQLIKFGGDWESLLRGKVTVIGDPFLDIPVPPPQRTAPPPVPQRPQPTPRAPSYVPPRPQPAPTITNKHPGFCFNCGTYVASHDGVARKLAKWEVFCHTHAAATPEQFRAPKKPSTMPKPTIADLTF